MDYLGSTSIRAHLTILGYLKVSRLTEIGIRHGKLSKVPHELMLVKIAALVNLLQPAEVDLAGAEDEEPQWAETGEVGMSQDKGHVLKSERFPLMQADQDIATLNPGLAGRPLLVDI